MTLFLHGHASTLCMFEKNVHECSVLSLDSESDLQESESECDIDDEKLHFPVYRSLARNQNSAITCIEIQKSDYTLDLLRPPKTA